MPEGQELHAHGVSTGRQGATIPAVYLAGPAHPPPAATLRGTGGVRDIVADLPNRERRSDNRWLTTSRAYGAHEPDPDLGAGARPNFRLGEHRREVSSAPTAQLSRTGFDAWYQLPPETPFRGRRHLHATTSGVIVEPHIMSQHTRGDTLDPYMYRRTMSADQMAADAGYRRHLRHLEPVEHEARPGGRRFIAPQPYRPPRPEGVRRVSPPPRKMEDTLEGVLPGVPRLGRQSGKHGTDRSTTEMQLEDTFSRLRKVDSGALKGQGAAGDMTGALGAPMHVELAAGIWQQHIDSPTYSRFLKTLLPPPEISCHQRRAIGMERQRLIVRQGNMNDVRALDAWENKAKPRT